MATVLGIDLGNSTSKIGIATSTDVTNLSISILEPPTLSQISFDANRRIIGRSLKASEKSDLLDTISSLTRLAGRSIEDGENFQIEQKFICAPLIDADGSIGVEVDYRKERRIFSATQLIAMLLRKVFEVASKERQNPISNITVSVPTWYTSIQRDAILDASFVAGLPPVALLNDATSIVLDYSISHTDLSVRDTPVNVVFVDIGESDYSVTIASFSEGRTEIKSVACDPHFGGRDIDYALAAHFAQEFESSHQVDLLNDRTTFLALLTECQMTKEALSTANEADLNFHSVTKDVYFKSRITRQSFEKIISTLLDRIPGPLQETLSKAGIICNQIYAIELIGGSTCIPAVKTRIQTFFDGTLLSTSLSHEFSVARGATYASAMLFTQTSEGPCRSINDTIYPIEIMRNGPSASTGLITSTDTAPENTRHVAQRKLVLMKEEEDQMYRLDSIVLNAEESRDALCKYISSLRDALSGPYAEYLKPTEKAQLLKSIEDIEFWLLSAYPWETASSGYKERQAILQSLDEPIAERYREAQELPQATAHLRELIRITSGVPADDENRRHDPSIVEYGKVTLKWLDEQLAKQAQLPKGIDPVLRVKHVEDKSKELRRLNSTRVKGRKRQEADPRGRIAKLRQLVQRVPENKLLHAQCLFLLGTMLQLRFNEQGMVDDIDEANKWFNEAVKFTPEGHIDRPVRLNKLGLTFFGRFKRLGDISDIEKAIINLEEAVHITQDSHPNKRPYLNNLGNSLSARFERLGDISDLDKAISNQDQAVRITPHGHPDKPDFLNNLVDSHLKRFKRLGDLDDLNKAISDQEEVVRITPDDYPNKSGFLNNIGILLLKRFERIGDVDDLHMAISAQEKAVQITLDGHPDKAGFLANIGNSLLKRFQRLRNVADLDEAISSHTEAVRITQDGHPDKPRFLNNIGISLLARFDRLGDISDLDKAISGQSEAAKITQDSDPDKPVFLNGLGISLMRRFQRLGDIGDLDRAIASQEVAVRLTPDGHPIKPNRLNNLGNSLLKHFEQLGAISVLEKSISCHRDALRLTPNGHLVKAGVLNGLGNSLLTRFEELAEIGDLDEAISGLREAVRITPDDHPDKPGRLNNFCNALLTRFERFGDTDDLDNTIFGQEEVVRITQEGYFNKPRFLDNLGGSYLERFQRLGEVADLDKAVSTQREAVRITSDGHPDKPHFLDHLSISLLNRFERLGDIDDLDKANSGQEEAVRITADGHPDRPHFLSNFGNSRLRRFQRSGKIADLNKAIWCQEEAARIMPDNHANRPSLFSNLGSLLLRRFQQLGDIADLQQAVSRQEEAVKIMAGSHADKSGLLNNLANALRSRFEQLGDVADIDRAIAVQRDAVQTVPEGHPNQSRDLCNIGTSLSVRFRKLGDVMDRKQSILAYSRVAGSFTAYPALRFRAATSWLHLAHGFDDTSELDAYECALDLLPRLAWLGLNIDSRYEELLKASTLACDAAAIALTANDPRRALEWLEQGRSIVWGQLLQLRTPLNDLHETNPELADRLATVSVELESGKSQRTRSDLELFADQDINAEETAQKQRRLAEQWEKLVQQVRELPRFGDFLQPKQYSQLLDAARVGPVVVLNVSKFRCDALILVSPSEPLRQVPLNNFSHKRAKALQDLLHKVLSSLRLRHREDERHGGPVFAGKSSTDDVFRIILEELWTCIVRPVLDALSLDQSLNPRRVWWCPTGPLAFLPIHAAGLYNAESRSAQVSLANFAVSSYTPTLSALLAALNNTEQQDFKLLAVIQPNTPGASVLPGTVEELKFIRKHVSAELILPLERTEATAQEVLSRMQEYPWVHFACHGVQDIHHPTKSGLLLQDGRLELSEIIKKSLPHAELAFLSACQTAQGDESHPDEAIHLAAGMLLAGYRGVVATMWSIQDNDAPFIADEMYARLMNDKQPSSANAASALHRATQLLRERYKDSSFASWVPFIHVGV